MDLKQLKAQMDVDVLSSDAEKRRKARRTIQQVAEVIGEIRDGIFDELPGNPEIGSLAECFQIWTGTTVTAEDLAKARQNLRDSDYSDEEIDRYIAEINELTINEVGQVLRDAGYLE